MRAIISALLLSLCGIASVQAETISLDAEDSSRSLNAQVELLEDPGAQLSITDLQTPEALARFQPSQGKPASGKARTPGGSGSAFGAQAMRRGTGGWRSAR